MCTSYKVIVVDDEPLARKGLKILLSRRDDFSLVAECSSGKQALSAISELDPDVVLLDIQMPGKDGMDVVKSLQGDSMPLIVFVTAYNQYAVEAFEVQAADYILKPVDPSRLNETLDRCKQRLQQEQFRNDKARLLALCEGQTQRNNAQTPIIEFGHMLKIQDGKNLYRFNSEKIYWIEAAGDYICIHTETENNILKSTLKKLEEELLDERFLRVHRSTIVNVVHIYKVNNLSNGEYQIELQNGDKIRTGRKYKNEVRGLLNA